MTTAIDPARTRPQERVPQEITPPEPDRETSRDGSIGQNLPPIPRAARPAVAGVRKRLRSVERSRRGVAVAVTMVLVAAVVMVLVARSRRRSPAEELMSRLERVPERISKLDV